MAPPGDDSYDRLHNYGPRRAETLPVRFDENPSQIPENGVYRRRVREERYTAGIPSPLGTRGDENKYYNFYDDERTARIPRRTLSPSPPPPETSKGRPRSRSASSLASMGRRGAHEFTHTGSYMGYQPPSYYNFVPPIKERIGDDYYFDRAAARDSPYYTRHASSRSRWRSRSRSRSRNRYTRSRSSSHGKVPNLSHYGVKYEGLGSKTAEIDFELSLPESETYSLKLSRHIKDSLQLGYAQDSNSACSEKQAPTPSTPPLQSHRSLMIQRPKVDRIIKSHYKGDGNMRGMHSVEFTVAPGQATSTGRLPIPLFNWVYFEDSSMNFDSFQNSILNFEGLKEGERFGISQLLERVKRRYDRTLQVSSRTKVHRMVPKLLQEPIRDETPIPVSKPRKLTWLCLPYFSLQKYTASDVQSSSNPPRTLLQTWQSMTTKERDLKQAVCHLPETPAGSCFHIGQAWFLILDDSFIISCTGLSTAQLTRNSISLVPYRNNSPGPSMRTLLVSGYGSTLWSFPLEECNTWIDFVKHFFELWPEGFEFSYHGNTITSKDWPRIFKHAENSKVYLEFKLSSKLKKSPTGILKIPREPNRGFGKDVGRNDGETGASNQPNSNTTDLGKSKPDLNTKDSGTPTTHPSTAKETILSKEFHIFNWINTDINVPNNSKRAARSPSTPNPVASLNEILLRKDLQEIDDYLLQKTNLNDQLTYKACPRHTRKEFYDVLFEVECKVQANQSLRTTYELQVELANAAEALFGFFLSPQNSGPTTEKYWGPLYDIILAMLPYGLIQLDGSLDNEHSNLTPHMFSVTAWSIDTRDVKYLANWMEFIARKSELFKELLSEVPIAERCEIEISDKLPRAWLHLLMAIAFTKKDMAPPWYKHMNLCLELINQGMKETIQTLSKYQLSDYVVFAPFDVASLVTFQLSQDLTGSCPDVCETYVEYMRSLESDIEEDPINRKHQGRITDLKQEISVILETLEIQKEVLHDAQNAQLRPNFQEGRVNRVKHTSRYEYKPSTYVETRPRNNMSYERPTHYRDNHEFDVEMKTPGPLIDQISPNNPSWGVQGLLFRESLALIEERIQVFRDINDRATYLESWNLRSIDTNKDRQDTAIYAFTIVTIIFLPLSTVASILGMNTNDVRNMELTQWLFWIIAIPLTIIIIGLVLIWSDEWYNFWNGFSNLWGKKTKRRYVRLPEDYTMVEPRNGMSVAPEARASGVYKGYYPTPPGPVPRLRRSRTIFGGGEYVPEGY